MWIVIYGNPMDGLSFVGPFHTAEDALEYASQHIDADDWWTANVAEPTKS